MKLHQNECRENLPEKAELIWQPSDKITDKQLDEYLNEIINDKSYNLEQAIGLLNFYQHDIKKALQASKKFKPKPDEWNKEEKIMFEHAYWFHGKNFNKIKLLVS